MIRQAENKCKIEGILSEINLQPITFKKNGVDAEAIGGNIVVKVTQKITGVEKELSIPVHMFATKLTNKGTANPAYESIMRLKEDFVSIAAAGNEEDADCVRITNGNIRMNEFYGADGRFISTPRINASFINKIKKSECHSEATFTTEFVVSGKSEEIGSDGEPTGRYMIKGILPQYGGKVDVVPFYAESEGVIDAVSTYWNVNDTVRANGRIDFSHETKTFTKEVDFGEPIEEIRTITKSNLIITGGSQEPLDGEFGYNHDEIQAALTERKQRIEAQRDKDMMKRTSHKAAPAQSNQGFADLGF